MMTKKNTNSSEKEVKKQSISRSNETVAKKTSDSLYPSIQGFTPSSKVPVGGVILAKTPIEYHQNRNTIKLKVRNTGDRPIQIGSHFHFFEVNRYMEFDRHQAFGFHLNVPATTAVRFEPGEEKEVELVSFGGKRRVIGFNNLVDGYTGIEDAPTFFPARTKSFQNLVEFGFKTSKLDQEAKKNKKETSK